MTSSIFSSTIEQEKEVIKMKKKGKSLYTVTGVSKQINLSYWKFVALARRGDLDFVKAEKINGIWKYYFDPLKTAKYLNEYKEVTEGRV